MQAWDGADSKSQKVPTAGHALVFTEQTHSTPSVHAADPSYPY